MKKYLALVVGLIALTATLGWWLMRPKTEIVQPTLAKVIKKDLQVSFTLDGEVVAETYEPKLTISGRVQSVLVKEGQSVKKGQWLLTLDQTEAQKNLEKALRDYSKERNDFDEATQVTYADTDLTDTLKRILEKNQWDLELSVMDVELKDLALKESRLLAPASGVVAKIEVKPGDVVSTQNQASLVTIAVPNSLSFEASAEEAEVLKIDEGQSVYVTLDTYPKERLTAELSFVAPIAERDSNGIVSYPVTAKLNPGTTKILDGMEGTLTFVTKEVPDVLTIPNTAVYRESEKSYVDVMVGDKISRREIKTGFTNGKEVEVKSGLETGEQVVIHK